MSHGIFRSATKDSTCTQSKQQILIGELVFYSFLTNREYSIYSKSYKQASVITKDYNKALAFEERLSFANH